MAVVWWCLSNAYLSYQLPRTPITPPRRLHTNLGQPRCKVAFADGSQWLDLAVQLTNNAKLHNGRRPHKGTAEWRLEQNRALDIDAVVDTPRHLFGGYRDVTIRCKDGVLPNLLGVRLGHGRTPGGVYNNL